MRSLKASLHDASSLHAKLEFNAIRWPTMPTTNKPSHSKLASKLLASCRLALILNREPNPGNKPWTT